MLEATNVTSSPATLARIADQLIRRLQDAPSLVIEVYGLVGKGFQMAAARGTALEADDAGCVAQLAAIVCSLADPKVCRPPEWFAKGSWPTPAHARRLAAWALEHVPFISLPVLRQLATRCADGLGKEALRLKLDENMMRVDGMWDCVHNNQGGPVKALHSIWNGATGGSGGPSQERDPCCVIFVLDVSRSMHDPPYQPVDRLTPCKQSILSIVEKHMRDDDNIALVSFATEVNVELELASKRAHARTKRGGLQTGGWGQIGVDGHFGAQSIRALQSFLTSQPSGCESAVDGGFGSQTQRSLQRFLQSQGNYYRGQSIDGSFGKASTKALQQWMSDKHGFRDGGIDGSWGGGTTRALQKTLNKLEQATRGTKGGGAVQSAVEGLRLRGATAFYDAVLKGAQRPLPLPCAHLLSARETRLLLRTHPLLSLTPVCSKASRWSQRTSIATTRSGSWHSRTGRTRRATPQASRRRASSWSEHRRSTSR